jgi:hypothetical protein
MINFYLSRGYLVTVYAFFQKGTNFTSELHFQCHFFRNNLFFQELPFHTINFIL